MRTVPHAASLCLALAVLGGAAAALADDGAIKLISRGPRHDTLTAMTYKPFDGELWSKLDGWTGASPITKESTKGKPVLIVAWASWYLTSHSALAEAQEVADKYPDLIVVGVHHQNGYEKAPDVVAAKGAKFAIAHDTKKEFFPALKIEAAGPNFYVLDRAGNLRFPDVDKSSLDAAAKIVSDEKAEDAAKAGDRAKEAAKEKGDKPLAGPDVKERPSVQAYKAAAWPKTNPNGGAQAKDVQGKPLSVQLGKETWITPKPDLAGRVIVLDFWATWCGPCVAASPTLDKLQDEHKNDLVVIGMSGQASHGSPEDVDAIKSYLKRKKSSYSHANDLKQNIYKSLGIGGIPLCVVMSSDGVVRWEGNPHDPEFVASVEKVVKADPWVQARSKDKKSGS